MSNGAALVALTLFTPLVAMAQPVRWDPADGGNGHWYELVIMPPLNWFDAQDQAASRTWQDQPGALASITSAEENAFLVAIHGNELERKWLGALQDPAGLEPAGGWEWLSGEPWDYENWAAGEPNQFDGEEEDALQFKWTDTGAVLGTWNDVDPLRSSFRGRGFDGFVTEYPPSCTADCDADGELTFFDFLCFQNAFSIAAAYADCDGDGSLTFFDFLCFQNEFAAGCP